MQCGVWNQIKIWSSHLLENLSNCLMNLKNSGDSTGFEPITSAIPVQCSHQLSYEVTQWRPGQFVGLMFSRERNVIWKKCYMQCGVWNQMKIWSSHLLDNLSNCLMNLYICNVHCALHITFLSFFRFMRQLLKLSSNCLMNLYICSVHCALHITFLSFFRFMRQLLKLSSKCEDHIFIWFQTPHCI